MRIYANLIFSKDYSKLQNFVEIEREEVNDGGSGVRRPPYRSDSCSPGEKSCGSKWSGVVQGRGERGRGESFNRNAHGLSRFKRTTEESHAAFFFFMTFLAVWSVSGSAGVPWSGDASVLCCVGVVAG